MLWMTQVFDRRRVPTAWHAPVGGDSIAVGDGDDYGFCYQPQIFGGDLVPVTYSAHGFLGEGEATANSVGGIRRGLHPFFALPEDAICWLVRRNLPGRVVRYAHHKPAGDRHPVWGHDDAAGDWRWQQYRPWIASGVVAVVAGRACRSSTT